MTGRRIDDQIAFLTEVDRLKSVDRSTFLIDNSRVENAAEHSWHLALFALVLAPYAAPNVDIERVILMLLLHDIVEVDVGDHPIDIAVDWAKVAAEEAAAAERLFGLLPDTQGGALLALWQEFEAKRTAEARFAKYLDSLHPMILTLQNPNAPADHRKVVTDNLATGRAAVLETAFPEAWAFVQALLAGAALEGKSDFTKRMQFLAEADRLKTVGRATELCDGSRKETSGEHSWHIALYALILQEHAHHEIDITRVIKMLLIHDLVEIDAGDRPIHGSHDLAAIEAEEQAAAERIFGLLPASQRGALRTLWAEFEAAETADAIFAKSVDRVQPVIANLETGGGSWVEYNVSRQQLEDRVGWKVEKGAPAVWQTLQARIADWYATHR